MSLRYFHNSEYVDISLSVVNDFSQDSSCIALYKFESGALEADSKGNCDLITSAVVADELDRVEGISSGLFPAYEFASARILESRMPQDFPLKYGTDNQTFSFSLWVKFYNLSSNVSYVLSKYDYTLCFVLYGTTSGFRVRVSTDGSNWTNLSHNSALEINTWYHIVFTKNANTNDWRIRVHDLDGVLGTDATGIVGNLNLDESSLDIGYHQTVGFEGKIDEFVVFNSLYRNQS